MANHSSTPQLPDPEVRHMRTKAGVTCSVHRVFKNVNGGCLRVHFAAFKHLCCAYTPRRQAKGQRDMAGMR